MQMYYCYDDPDTKKPVIVEYALQCDPPEAMYWATYKLSKKDIKIITPMDRSEQARMRELILQDIFVAEPNIRQVKRT